MTKNSFYHLGFAGGAMAMISMQAAGVSFAFATLLWTVPLEPASWLHTAVKMLSGIVSVIFLVHFLGAVYTLIKQEAPAWMKPGYAFMFWLLKEFG